MQSFSYFTQVSYIIQSFAQISILYLVSVIVGWYESRHDSWASESNERRHDSVPGSLGPHNFRAPTNLKDLSTIFSIAKLIESVVVK